ncbi:DUF2138 family protein, partial [Escherichia coli]
IVSEQNLTLKDNLFSTILDKTAKEAQLLEKKGQISHYMGLIKSSGLSKLMEPFFFASTSYSQLRKTEITSIKKNSETIN